MEGQSKRIISTCVGKGRRHDFHLFKKSKTRIYESIKATVDLGYQGIGKYHSNSIHPKKNLKKKPLTKQEKKENQKINSQRVIVEHVIRKIKIFKILADRYRNRRKRFGLRLNLICAIYNFEL